MTLYFASTNRGKLLELREGARAYGLDVVPLPGLEKLPPPLEDGSTFQANARQKALYYGALSNGLLLAEDSGLTVPALGNVPGVHSARFAGPGAGDQANNELLLAKLRGIAGAGRAAHYSSVIALVEHRRVRTMVEGRAEGVILSAPRGTGGFGYDPVFYFPPLGKTFAEMSRQEKWAVSHRGGAFRALVDYLRNLPAGGPG